MSASFRSLAEHRYRKYPRTMMSLELGMWGFAALLVGMTAAAELGDTRAQEITRDASCFLNQPLSPLSQTAARWQACTDRQP